MNAASTLVGQGIDRRDGREKVMGAAHYAAEFHRPGLVHAVLVQSTIAHGALTAIDTAAAMRMPGVLAVITPANAERLAIKQATPQTITAPLLQNDDVVFNGQHIAIVVADTLDRALEAAASLAPRYRATEAVTRMDPSTAYVPTNFRGGERPPDSHRGDANAAFETAPTKLDVTYTTPIEHHNAMEPHATIAEWEGGKLTVWTATQGIAGAHATLATLFGLPLESVRVICPFVGGGFGSKGNAWPPLTLAAMAARKVGRPVKLVLTRAQMFTSNGYRPATIQRLRLGALADGTLTSVRHDGISQMSDRSQGEFVEPVALVTEMLYAAPNAAITHRLVGTNMGLPTYMRAPGEASGNFAIESAMDELAVALKMDPLELRLKNYAESDPSDGRPFSSKPLRECYRQAAAAFGWDRRKPAPRSMRDGRDLIGWGMATSTYPTNRMPAKARVQINPDGSAIVQSATQDLGTGTYTVMAQVAADELGLPVMQVRFELGDSLYPKAPVSGGSMTVASVSPAVQAAARAARDKVLALALSDRAQDWPGVTADQLRFVNGAVVAPNGHVTIGELLARQGMPFVEAEASTEPGAEKKQFSMHAFGAQFAEVRVDPDLGMIRVSRWVGAFDCGRQLNTKTVQSQLIGGITFGIGMALLEETNVDARSGRITNANISEYLLPVNADIPDITAIVVDNIDPHANPLGVKGVGELPMVGVAAAIANAVFHATGIRVRDLPIRLEQLLA